MRLHDHIYPKIVFKRLALPSSGPVPYYIIPFPSGNIVK